MLEDAVQRERALDITRSFIVQAPAGSGKTTLLTQRYIKLYQSNSVNHPEEIIAITFTRKAASEMRHRIITALNQAETYTNTNSAPDPSCLRIMTIDAFCKFLSAQMPCESRLSHRTQITENPNSFYLKAIQHIFSGEKLDAYSEECLECFLLYLDNDMTRVNTLLINLLASRDQWLWHIPTLAQEEAVEALENAWKSVGLQYTSPQKKFVGMLSHLLLLLITELKKIFDDAQEMDFIEVSLRALEALGDEEFPTDLTLKLDYQIKHILVDEFQDTSVSQWRLLQKLTAGFEPNDGRTLFLVGDPMQSIYRFRKAEVGLFLEVQKKGIGQLKPEVLTLSTNFRSTASIIDWVNQSFPKIFPKKADIYLGAIPYSASTIPSLLWEANKTAELPASVFYYPVRADQSHDIILIIQSLTNSIKSVSVPENSSLQTIAVLVRSRSHLQSLIRLLEKEQINFTAAEIDTWNDHPLVMDLFSLTRALLHPGDRIAWLSILRAPWCGCDLHELAQLCENDHESTVWSLLQQYQSNSNSINRSNSRINYFIKILSEALAVQGRVTLREWVENTWLALKGPACFGAYFSDVEHSFQEGLEIAEYFFDLLDEIEPYYYSEKIALLQEKLSARKNRHRVFKSNQFFHVELMTIHKAKGLEFDHVIIPYLDKITRQDASKLFLWEESINARFEVELLIAPIPAKNTKDKLYDYLKQSENQRGYYELQRLFYVAATRAKKTLHLVFSTEIKAPSKNSFLHLLWEPLKLSERFILQGRAVKSSAEPSFSSGKLFRLPKEAFGEESQKAQVSRLSQEEKITALPLLAEYQRRHLGTILHEVLELLSQGCVLGEEYLKIKLSQLMGGDTEGYSVIQRCLENIQSDPVAKWILSSHPEAKSEYKLSTKHKQFVIDRTFVDQDNRRWIIDYKITEEVSVEPYRRQLENYAQILREIDSRPIFLGLYFPLTKDWLHWEYLY